MNVSSLGTRRPTARDGDIEILIGPNHKICWAGTVSHGVEVQLRDLDDELIAVIVSGRGPLTPEMVQLAMPYVREIIQYTIQEEPA